jgi:hypothetical protein
VERGKGGPSWAAAKPREKREEWAYAWELRGQGSEWAFGPKRERGEFFFFFSFSFISKPFSSSN